MSATICIAESRLSLSGSSTIGPLLSEIGQRYESSHPEIRIDVQTGGSSRGVSDAINGLADIGMSSRELFKGEQIQLKSYEIALDGVAFVVHSNNPLRNLSREQAKKIYLGQIKNWKALGWEDHEITVIEIAESFANKVHDRTS